MLREGLLQLLHEGVEAEFLQGPGPERSDDSVVASFRLPNVLPGELLLEAAEEALDPLGRGSR